MSKLRVQALIFVTIKGPSEETAKLIILSSDLIRGQGNKINSGKWTSVMSIKLVLSVKGH